MKGRKLLPFDPKFVSAIGKPLFITGRGIDISMPRGTPIVAVGKAKIIYSGPQAPSSCKSGEKVPGGCETKMILLKLVNPILIKKMLYNLIWYESLEKLVFKKSLTSPRIIKVKAGELLATSGAGLGVPHLNFRLLTENDGSIGAAMTETQLSSYIWAQIATTKSAG